MLSSDAGELPRIKLTTNVSFLDGWLAVYLSITLV